MKTYWSIPGPSKAPQQPCIAFYKYDGSNFRAEWSKKKGWHKFGTRRTMIDESDPMFGPAVTLFRETYGDDVPKVLKDRQKDYRQVDRITAYCEYFGPSSIGMWHDWEELHTVGELMLFDINVHKRGFVLPRDFVQHFGHLKIAEVVYEGNFNNQFVQDIWDGKYNVKEGVVAKGVTPNPKGRAEHGLWMAKCKTAWWFEALRRKYKETDNEKYQQQLKQLLADNEREQGI